MKCIHTHICMLQVSRSFAAVIRQLPKVLATDVLVFYLVLRGLDTVEDDMEAFKDVQVCPESANDFASHRHWNMTMEAMHSESSPVPMQ